MIRYGVWSAWGCVLLMAAARAVQAVRVCLTGWAVAVAVVCATSQASLWCMTLVRGLGTVCSPGKSARYSQGLDC